MKKCICEWCHKEFKTWDCRPGRFCSAQCRSEYGSKQPRGHVNKPERGGKTTWYCKECRKEMRTFKSRVRDTCSAKCNYLYWPKRTKLTIKCPRCGIDFIVHGYEVTSWDKKYCSKECQYADHSEKMRKKTFISFLDKIHTRGWRGPNWIKQSELARKRDNYICQSCGEITKRKLDVHHIKPFKLFNRDWESANQLSNLISLCSACHIKIERNVIPCPNPKR